MILYFANRKMQILGQASTTLPDGFVIQEDLKTEDVESGVSSFECTISYATESRSQIEEMMKAGNYILRSHDGENEFYTIIDYESDVKEQTVTVYAEDAGLDLLNEIAGKFENETAYNAAWYINKYIVDSGFEIGINEIPSSSVRTLSWDGESTVTERLASIANSFGGYEVSYSFEIDGLEVRRKFINFHEKRGKNESAQLRLNREIDNIRTTQSISNLATALRVTGGVPETDGTDEETPPITLVGYKYDDGDIFVGEDGILRSREALKKWSRYIWNNEPGLVGGAYEGHIAKFFTYETTDQAELCAHAVTELKRVCDMEVNYEIDINRLPDDVKIGDRVDVVDEAGELFLSTRILVLETSIVDQTQKATLGEYLIRNHGISEKVLKMAENLTSVARSAARAKANSAAALKKSEAAKAQATDAYNESLAANTKADEAKEQASQATQSASSATDKANTASASVEQIQAQVSEMDKDITAAQTAAQNAQEAAEMADAKADAANTAAQNAQADATAAGQAAEKAQTDATSAISKAETAQGTADDAKGKAEAAQQEVETIKQDVAAANEELEKFVEDLDSLSNTMQADYARKTELSETEASLQSQISQNAGQIASVVSKQQTVDETISDISDKADQAQAAAEAAQAQADTATADAAKAQADATAAATAANNAQSEADKAKAAAATAQSAADTANAELATAQSNLASVTSRVGATEEEIAEAQKAVEDAQSAADKAKADATAAANAASAAQSTADTAAANAAAAQTKANEAYTEAYNAKVAADNARGDATAAQQTADEAKTNAATAQSTANTAKNNAATAQAKADEAAEAADAAQSAAEAADAKAAAAQSDLDTAKANLADVTSRVGATEEEIAAAQAAVETAQTAADKAKSDAAAAQSTADTAKSNAATAQTAANNAKTAADNAQKAADDAQDAADAAQAAVDALAVRVTNAETSITQNSEEIALRAKKSEVETTLGGYYKKTETDALIKVESDKIASQATQISSQGTRISTLEQNAEGFTARLDGIDEKATNAQKVATNYLNFSNSGLVIGDMTASTLGNNVLIDSDSVDIRNGETILASYSANKIELGKGNKSSIIELCGAGATLKYQDFGASDGLDIISNGVRLYSDSDAYLMVLPTAITGVASRIGFDAENGISLYTKGDTIDIYTTDGSVILHSLNADVNISGYEVYLRGDLYFNGVKLSATAKEMNYCDGVTSNIQTQLDGKVNKRMFGYVYSDVACNYYGSNMSNYWRITIPVQAYVWSMLTLELTVKQTYDVGCGGKIIINAYHSGSDLYFYGFNATTLGTLGTSIAVYGSDNSYFYIGGCAGYSTLSVDKIIVGDAAVSLDLSNVIVDSVSSLPSAYQTATMYYGVNAVGGYVMAKNGIKIDDKLAVSIDDSSDGWLRLNNTDAFASGVYLGGRGAKVIGTFTCTSLSQTSSEEYKTNIIPYEENAIAKVMNAVVYSYNLINELEDGLDYKQYGFIIEREIPKEFVSADGKGVNLYNMIAILTKAIQEQQIHISELSKEIEALKAA